MNRREAEKALKACEAAENGPWNFAVHARTALPDACRTLIRAVELLEAACRLQTTTDRADLAAKKFVEEFER